MPVCLPVQLLAPGEFDGCAAGPTLAFASRRDHAASIGQLWDPAAGRPVGPPVPDLGDWAFADVLAWTHRDRVHVLCGRDELTIEPPSVPDLLGLAAPDGRTAVVAVSGPAHDARVSTWDARTGEHLRDFTVWLGHRSAIGHRLSSAGGLIALACDTDRERPVDGHCVCVLDTSRGEEVARHPSPGDLHAVAGTALAHTAPGRLLVHHLTTGEPLAERSLPGPATQLAAASVGDRPVFVTAHPGRLLTWDLSCSRPVHELPLSVPPNAIALAPSGIVLAATDQGLHTARLPLA